MLDKLNEIESRLQDVELQLSDPAVYGDMTRLPSKTRQTAVQTKETFERDYSLISISTPAGSSRAIRASTVLAEGF